MRTIIHLDLDAFFCAVEERQNPSLQGKAFAVGGRPEERGVVSSCSYPARRRGVRSAMPMSVALRTCPGLIVLPPRHRLYSQVSGQIMDLLHSQVALIEQLSIDEAFIDASDMAESGEMLARRLQGMIHQQFALPCSFGVAGNKLVAKIANDVGKAAVRGDSPPNAITVVPPGKEAEFLAPLPVQSLWGVGPKTAVRLEEIGVRSIGDLALLPVVELQRRFGKIAVELAQHARGIDESPIITSHELKSVSQEVTFARDLRDEQELHKTIQELSTMVAKRLAKSGVSGATVKLKLRWPDFTTITRQVTFPHPVADADLIAAAATQLFEKEWKPGKAVRLIGVGVTRLQRPSPQLNLFEYVQGAYGGEPDDLDPRLLAAVDTLRQRYGEDILKPASRLQRREPSS